MAKCNELNINIRCDLSVDKSTAETCVKLLEIYMNKNPGVHLIVKEKQNGQINLYMGEDERD